MRYEASVLTPAFPWSIASTITSDSTISMADIAAMSLLERQTQAADVVVQPPLSQAVGYVVVVGTPPKPALLLSQH